MGAATAADCSLDWPPRRQQREGQAAGFRREAASGIMLQEMPVCRYVALAWYTRPVVGSGRTGHDAVTEGRVRKVARASQ